MDNFRFDVTSEGRANLNLIVTLVNSQWRSIVGYRASAEHGLLLYWTLSDKATPFPSKLDIEATTNMIMGWLAEQEYGPEPDLDGHCRKGWRAYNKGNPYGRIDGEYQVSFAVQPEWAEFHK